MFRNLVVDGGGGFKGEFSNPLLPYLSKKVVSPPHLKILATPQSLILLYYIMFIIVRSTFDAIIIIIITFLLSQYSTILNSYDIRSIVRYTVIIRVHFKIFLKYYSGH
jgi:hypothetical protein